MKTIIIIGIIVVGIIGTVAIFASMPSDTWKDHRTGFTGVPLPDENKNKIDCLSRGGVWDNGCNIESKNIASQDEIDVEEIDGYAIDYDGDVKHLPFADICSDEMKIILLTHSNISSTDEEFAIEDIGLPFGMNPEDFERCAHETSFTKSRWNMVPRENPEPEPEPVPMSDSESLQRQKQQQAKIRTQEIILIDYRGYQHQIDAINEYREKFESGYFLEQFILPNKQNFEKNEMMNFVVVQWGYQPEECTSYIVKGYFKPYSNYEDPFYVEKISEWENTEECYGVISSDSSGHLIVNMEPMPGILEEQHQRCSNPGEYRILVKNLEDKSQVEWGYYTCQRDKLLGEPQPWMEIPE